MVQKYLCNLQSGILHVTLHKDLTEFIFLCKGKPFTHYHCKNFWEEIYSVSNPNLFPNWSYHCWQRTKKVIVLCLQEAGDTEPCSILNSAISAFLKDLSLLSWSFELRSIYEVSFC